MEFENEQSQSQETPEVLDKELAPSAETPEAAPELVDLDTMDKFKFGGREWTPKELEAAYMRQQDYSRKTQEIAQERKYYDNLPYDLDMVKNNPALVNQFKQVYPAKFHSWIDRVVGQAKQAAPQQPGQSAQTPQLPKEFQELRAEVDAFKKERFDAEVAKHSTEIDRIMSGLSKKYPFADEDSVLAKAQSLSERGQQVDEKIWNGLFKMVNDKNEKLLNERQAERIKQQKAASSKAKDVGFGGGTPGQAPRQFKTIKEATEAAMKDFA
jgi:hypothetical protein